MYKIYSGDTKKKKRSDGGKHDREKRVSERHEKQLRWVSEFSRQTRNKVGHLKQRVSPL